MSAAKSLQIIGAGALGSTIAYVAARAGWRVRVTDPGPPSGNASAVAAGMLAPAFECLLDEASAGHFPLLREARDLWPPLAEELGIELERNGAMGLGRRDEAEAWADKLRALGADAALVPTPDGRWGALTGEDWRLDPAAALGAVYRKARDHGAEFAADWKPSDVPRADAVVIATGASQDYRAEAPELARLTPVKGHILHAAGRFARGPVLRIPGAYLCRTPHEAILGATMEVGRNDGEIDDAVVAQLLSTATPLLAELDAVKWIPRVGVRASTPDGLPMAGVSRRGGGRVLVAVGARRNGWLLAPMIAGVILDVLEGRGGSGTAALFDPARFAAASPC